MWSRQRTAENPLRNQVDDRTGFPVSFLQVIGHPYLRHTRDRMHQTLNGRPRQTIFRALPHSLTTSHCKVCAYGQGGFSQRRGPDPLSRHRDRLQNAPLKCGRKAHHTQI